MTDAGIYVYSLIASFITWSWSGDKALTFNNNNKNTWERNTNNSNSVCHYNMKLKATFKYCCHYYHCDITTIIIIIQSPACSGRQTQLKYSTKTYTILHKKLQIFTRQITQCKIIITAQYNPYTNKHILEPLTSSLKSFCLISTPSSNIKD